MVGEWSLDELSRTMQVPPTVLRKKIGFWQSHGLLVKKTADVFYLVEKRDDTHVSNAEIVVEDYESESAMASAQDQREEELQVQFTGLVSLQSRFSHFFPRFHNSLI